MNMYTLTLWEPWASLIAHGYKWEETRSWPVPTAHVGTRIAIHAGQRRVQESDIDDYEDGLLVEALGVHWRQNLLYGHYVATVQLEECWQIDRPSKIPPPSMDYVNLRAEVNRAFGHYAIGRWIWPMANIRRLTTHIHGRGRQKIFDTGLPVEEFEL